MKFLGTAAAALALANTAIGSPLAAIAAARGRTLTRRPGPSTNHRNITIPSDSTAAQASSNWAGAVIVTTGVTEVVGTFTVPTPSIPPGGSSGIEYCGAAWAGIDGDTCQSGLIQTGVFWCVLNGQLGYEAWYEWIPQASNPLNVAVNPGDSITVTITKSSTTSGVTTLINNSNGQRGSFTFTNEPQGTLCGQNAEWIVEDFESGGALVPFANFGKVTFTGASAVVNGQTVTPGSSSGTDTIFLEQNGQTLTSTSFSGGTVSVSYV